MWAGSPRARGAAPVIAAAARVVLLVLVPGPALAASLLDEWTDLVAARQAVSRNFGNLSRERVFVEERREKANAEYHACDPFPASHESKKNVEAADQLRLNAEEYRRKSEARRAELEQINRELDAERDQVEREKYDVKSMPYEDRMRLLISRYRLTYIEPFEQEVMRLTLAYLNSLTAYVTLVTSAAERCRVEPGTTVVKDPTPGLLDRFVEVVMMLESLFEEVMTERTRRPFTPGARLDGRR